MDPELEPSQDGAGEALSAPHLDSPRNARVFWGRVARVHRKGDPLVHPNSDTWRERYRDEIEIDRIVAQLPGKKLASPPGQAIRHPAMLTDPTGKPTGAPHRVTGRVLSAQRDGDWALAEILVEDPDTIAAIEAGVKELSLGYYAGKDAEGFQRNTRVDHLTVVPFGRCGETCALQVDEGEPVAEHVAAIEVEPVAAAPDPVAPETPALDAVTGTGQPSPCQCKTHAVSLAQTPMDEIQKQLQATQAELTALKAMKDAAEARATQAEKERDAARVAANDAKKDLDAETARADQAQKDADDAKVQAQKDAADSLGAQVDARVDLIANAQPILGKTLKVKNAEGKDEDRPLSKFSDREIMTAVVKHVDGDEIAETESMDYVKGMAAGAFKRGAKSSQSRQNVRQAVQSMRDAAPKQPLRQELRAREEDALARMNRDMQNRHAR